MAIVTVKQARQSLSRYRKAARKTLSSYSSLLKKKQRVEGQLAMLSKLVLEAAENADEAARHVSTALSAVAEAKVAHKRGKPPTRRA